MLTPDEFLSLADWTPLSLLLGSSRLSGGPLVSTPSSSSSAEVMLSRSFT